MIVFVSSVRTGFETFREGAVEGAGLVADRVIRFEEMPASPDPSQKACLDGVRQSDIVILAMGARYGKPQPKSGISPTHEEYQEAARLGKPVLAFVQQGSEPEPAQAKFIAAVQGGDDWTKGRLAPRFATVAELKNLVTRGLVAILTRRVGQHGERDYAEQFRDERLALLIKGDTPVPLMSSRNLILHAVPATAGDSRRVVDLGLLRQSRIATIPLYTGGLFTRFNVEGHLAYVPGQSNDVAIAYAQVFKSGAIEAVVAEVGFAEEVTDCVCVNLHYYEPRIKEMVAQYLRVQDILHAELPISVMISLTGARGVSAIPHAYRRYGRGIFDRDVIKSPPVSARSFSEPVDMLVHPVLDFLWNAAGYEGSPNFDSLGRHRASRR